MNNDQYQLIAFIGVLIFLLVAERIFPRRERHSDQTKRISNNFGFTLLNTLVVRIISPVTPYIVAVWVAREGIGVFQMISLPLVFNVVFAILLLDLIIYLEHVVFHRVPFFWRFHKVHHLDLDLDVTSGFRFHLLESIISIMVKIIAILLLGFAPLGVLIFEIILSVMAMFTHANLKLPLRLDRYVRYIFVTPDMHRVHHSVIHDENDSNFGFNLIIWDKIFQTYIAQPSQGHDDMAIGLSEYQEQSDKNFFDLFLDPFRRRKPPSSK